jgi:hypothetical protein
MQAVKEMPAQAGSQNSLCQYPGFLKTLAINKTQMGSNAHLSQANLSVPYHSRQNIQSTPILDEV